MKGWSWWKEGTGEQSRCVQSITGLFVSARHLVKRARSDSLQKNLAGTPLGLNSESQGLLLQFRGLHQPLDCVA